ncbi:MAG: hypothetical protein GY827_03375, partial [Cytophagales bacterium]|nr:hypothetical protein [Cytophagales bacterium]
YKEAFHESCAANDPKDVANAFKGKIKDLLTSVNGLLNRKSQYPFLEKLSSLKDLLSTLSNQEYAYFITNLKEFEDDLLDMREDILDPIQTFMNGDQINIYDDIKKMAQGDVTNYDYVQAEDERNTLTDFLANNVPYKGNVLRTAKAAMDALNQKVKERLEEAKQETITTIEETMSFLKEKEGFEKIPPHQQQRVLSIFEEEVNRVQGLRYISSIEKTQLDVEKTHKKNQLALLLQYISQIEVYTPPITPTTVVNDPDNTVVEKPTKEDKPTVSTPQKDIEYLEQISVKFNKQELMTEKDVDAYVKALQEVLKKEINNNKIILL